jgi:hypothetical protein
MHGNFRSLFDIVKLGAPLATQIVTTAGNVDFKTTVGDADLDRLVVSCDGSRQKAYAQYRRGGDLQTVIKFMRDSKKCGSRETFLEWKYILFEFNDSDEDILHAQKIADGIGVDSLLFIITNSKWHSKRFTVDNSDQIPIESHFAMVSPAAAMNAVAVECSAFPVFEDPKFGFGYIDKCTVSIGKFLTVEGWAYDQTGEYASMVELVVDGETRAKSRTNSKRIDVANVHTAAAGPKCGFMFRISIDPHMLPSTIGVRILGVSGSAEIGGFANWILTDAGIKIRQDLPAFTPSLQSVSKRALESNIAAE